MESRVKGSSGKPRETRERSTANVLNIQKQKKNPEER
jgi:hypothetical protein